MSLTLKDKKFTVEEYFKLEEEGEMRHEFINGNLFEMREASTEHHLLVKRFEKLFDSLFEQKRCSVFRETMKVKIYDEEKYYYPDLFIIQYQKFPALKYYFIAEQDKPEITVVNKNAKGNWQSETYSGKDAVINLLLFDVTLSLSEIYL